MPCMSMAHSLHCLTSIGWCCQVYKGMYREHPVAVKVCRKANLNATAMKQFQKEVSILQHCSHANIVAFIGACTWKVCPPTPS